MHRRKLLIISLLIVALFSLGFATTTSASGPIGVTGEIYTLAEARAADAAKAASLTEFIGLVKNGNPDAIVGVYVPGVLALPVIQQPSGNASYVSEKPDVVTQFRMATQYGTTGLLAHNTLSGALFFEISMKDEVVLVYGDGKTEQYQVKRIREFQALTPYSPYSDFVDLDTPDQLMTASDLFNQVYRGRDQVVFQTCIENSGDPSWGRLFITAEPYVPVATRRAPYTHRMGLLALA